MIRYNIWLTGMISFLMVLFTTVVFAQYQIDWDRFPDEVKERKSFIRYYEFHRIRQMEDGSIPVDIYWQVRDQELAKESRRIHPRELEWTNVGPSGVGSMQPHWGINSGRVRGLGVHPVDPNIAFVGSASGGIWKTVDGGESWADVGVHLESLTFGAIAFDPQNPDVIYAGTGEPSYNGYSYDGHGMYKSEDLGETWRFVGQDDFGIQTRFSGVAVDPFDSDIVYASLFTGDQPGIWRSVDAGENWQRVIEAVNGLDVLTHPGREGRVYAVSRNGFQVSNDHGETWIEQNTGLPAPSEYDWLTRMHLALHYDGNLTTIYLAIHWQNQVGVYKTINDGLSWEQIFYVDSGEQGWYDLDIGVSPNDANHAFLLTNILRETTDGINFTPVTIPGSDDPYWGSPMHVDYHQIAYSLSDPDIIYVGCDGGVYQSLDGGLNWEHRNNGIRTLQFYRMSSSPSDADVMYGGAQDNGSFHTFDQGETEWPNSYGGDGMDNFVDHTNPNYVYMSSQNGGLVRSNNRGLPGSFSAIRIPGNEPKAWIAPYFMHPWDNNIIYSATSKPYRSTNRGNSWQAMGDLEFENAISQMAQSPVNPNHLLVAQGSQRPQITSDGGQTWSARGSGLPGRNITRAVFHPWDENTLFITFSGFYEGDKLYRSTNLGESWHNVSGDMPNIPCNTFYIDRADPNFWLLGTDIGVYYSHDGGQTWTRETGIPMVPVLDFDYFESDDVKYIRAATHGRGVYQAELPTTGYADIEIDRSEIQLALPQYQTATEMIRLSNSGTQLLEFEVISEVDWLTPMAPADSINPFETLNVPLLLSAESLTPDVYTTTLAITSNDSDETVITVPVQLTVVDSGTTILWQSDFSRFDPEMFYLSDDVFWDDTQNILWLTPPDRAQRGRIYLSEQRFLIDRFQARFDLRLGGGSGGEGMTFGFVPYFNYPALGGPTLDFYNTQGYAIEFDTELTAGLHDPSEEHIAFIFNRTDNHLAAWQAPDGALEDDQWHHVVIDFFDGYVRVFWDGEQRFDYRLTDYVPFDGYFGFTATTSNTTNAHQLDNVLLLGINTITDVPTTPAEVQVPRTYSLSQNYPNPFNPTTILRFGLPTTSAIKLDVFDVQGRLVETLVDGWREAGYHEVSWTPDESLPSGIYVYRLQAPDFSQSRRMLLLK